MSNVALCAQTTYPLQNSASLLKKVTFVRVTSSVVIGSVIYKACVALALRMGLPSTDLKMITAVLFLIILVVSMDRNKTAKIKGGSAK